MGALCMAVLTFLWGLFLKVLPMIVSSVVAEWFRERAAKAKKMMKRK
jgi:hypothetical protein